jgi:hypothetical protein
VPTWRVMYPDRIYGWQTLFVEAETSEEAIRYVEKHLGFSPPLIKAGPEIILKILDDG